MRAYNQLKLVHIFEQLNQISRTRSDAERCEAYDQVVKYILDLEEDYNIEDVVEEWDAEQKQKEYEEASVSLEDENQMEQWKRERELEHRVFEGDRS